MKDYDVYDFRFSVVNRSFFIYYFNEICFDVDVV